MPKKEFDFLDDLMRAQPKRRNMLHNMTAPEEADALQRRRMALGLSVEEQMAYETLLELGDMTATELASILQSHAQATYRLVHKLVRLGYGVEVPVWPRRYRAVPIEDALEQAVHNKMQEVRLVRDEVAHTLSSQKPDRDRNTGQPASGFTDDLLNARREVLVLASSVGDDTFVRVCAGLSLEGVKVKLLIASFADYDRYSVASLQTYGVEVKYVRQRLDFRVIIIDHERTYLYLDDVSFPPEPALIRIEDDLAVEGFYGYFKQMWQRLSLLRRM